MYKLVNSNEYEAFATAETASDSEVIVPLVVAGYDCRIISTQEALSRTLLNHVRECADIERYPVDISRIRMRPFTVVDTQTLALMETFCTEGDDYVYDTSIVIYEHTLRRAVEYLVDAHLSSSSERPSGDFIAACLRHLLGEAILHESYHVYEFVAGLLNDEAIEAESSRLRDYGVNLSTYSDRFAIGMVSILALNRFLELFHSQFLQYNYLDYLIWLCAVPTSPILLKRIGNNLAYKAGKSTPWEQRAYNYVANNQNLIVNPFEVEVL